MAIEGFPDVVQLKKISDSTTATAVPAGGHTYITITLSNTLPITAKATTTTTDAEVEVVGTTYEEITVKAINNGASDQDIAINYEVYGLKKA